MWTTLICRVCESTENLKSLIDGSNKFVLKKLRACADIVIDLNDELPKYICQQCVQQLNDAYRFKIKCEYADQKFREEIQQKQQQQYEEIESKTITTSMESTKNINDDDNTISLNYLTEQEQVINNCDDNEEDIIINEETLTENSVISKNMVVKIEYDDNIIDEDIIEEYIDDNESMAMFDHIDYNDNCVDAATKIELMFNENSSSGKDGKLNENIIDDDFIEFDNYEENEVDQEPEDVNEINENHIASLKVEECLILAQEMRSSSPESLQLRQSKKFCCDTCKENFDSVVKFNEHKKSHGNQRYQCPDCSRWFPKRYLMKNHQVTHTGIKSYLCPVCPKLYTNQGNRDRHIRVFHQNQRTHFCSHCGKSFSQLSTLRQHYSVHTAERNFVCEICEKSYKTQEYLNLHKYRHLPREMRTQKINNIKTTKKTKRKTIKPNNLNDHIFECSVCGKQSTTIVLHQNHMRTHTGEKPYECYVCNKRFSFSQSLKNHLLLHTGEKPYKCDICGMSFRQIGHLKGHKLTHTGQKKHSCNVCHKSFALRGNLTVHMRLHTGETPYHCKLCPKQFYDVNGLKRHQFFHENRTITMAEIKNIDKCRKIDMQQIEEKQLRQDKSYDFVNNMKII